MTKDRVFFSREFNITDMCFVEVIGEATMNGYYVDELDNGPSTLLPHFGPSPTPNSANQVSEPGTLALIGAGIALMMRKVKRVTRRGEEK